MDEPQNLVIIRKGNEELRYYGDRLSQLIAGGYLNSSLIKEQKKPSYVLIILLAILFLIVSGIPPQNYQMFKFLSGSVISMVLGVHLYIIYKEKFLFVGVIFIGILLSLTASRLLEISSLVQIMKSWVKS